ncbi:MAG: FAD-dependent oxidoreductase [Rhizobiaceae bacterium MnEN-MB40S]|nr:MAG: FAD-dependent oxidoreductase [Rhizobiaceae bacterium MnEN-MB40S]
MSEEIVERDVVIVGGGPVGMALAIELGQRGVSSAVIERYHTPQPIPKGQNLNQRTMELFHFWNAEKQLRNARRIPENYGIGGLTAYGTLLSDYHYDWLKREIVRPFYFRDNERLPQNETEGVLRERASELPQTAISYGLRAGKIGQDADGVWAEARDKTGAMRRFEGRYLVGCDGARSIVRDRAGITQTLKDHDRVMVLLVFRSTGLHTLLERYPDKQFYCVLHPDLKGYWRFFGRVDLGATWFFHAPVPPGTTEDNFDFTQLLYDAVGAEFDVAFEHIGFWDLRFATTDNYRSGRIFVAGDAAHSHPPYGGYGINTGFEDACNLGWKLAATLNGWGGPALLDSYNDERRPVFASTADDFIENFILEDRAFLERYSPDVDKFLFEAQWAARAASTAEVSAYVPNYAGSPVVFGPKGAESGAKGEHVYAARPGFHLTPQRLSSGDNIYERLGTGYTLLAIDAAAQAEIFRKAAADAGMPLTIINDEDRNLAETYAARLILVRPDQYVCWTGDGSNPDAGAVLKRVLGNS